MAVIGTLTVNLEANTAKFTGDLGKAGDGLGDFGKKAAAAGEQTDYSMGEARHGVMMLGEEFGVHLPRGLTTFIASLGPVGAAMEAAFPFLAIALGVTLLLEHFASLHEAAEKLTESQEKFGTTAQTSLNNLGDKVLEAGIKIDELNGNHLAALQKRLELIDHQSLKELSGEFDILSKNAEAVFANLKSHWYDFDSTVKGAHHALTEFHAKYDELLGIGKDKEASDLLAGTLASAKKIQALQETARAHSGGNESKQVQLFEARNRLHQEHIGWTDKDLEAQGLVVASLDQQVIRERKVNEERELRAKAERMSTGNKIGSDQDKKFRQEAEEARQAADAAEKEFESTFARAVKALQENEKQKIEATKEGSAARLAAIDAAIKEEQSKGLQETGFYRTLLEDRVNLITKMGEDEKKARAALSEGEVKQTLASAKLTEEADEQKAKHALAMKQGSLADLLFAEESAVKSRAQVETAAINQEIANLDKTDAMILVKTQEFENKKKLIKQQAENEIQKIEQTAQEKQFEDMHKALDRTDSAIASTAAKAIVSEKNMGDAFRNLGKTMLENALTNFMQMESLEERKRLIKAKGAAASAYESVMDHIPEPLSAVLAPIAAATAFAGVMAFEQGGKIPGSGPVPMIGHGGETVITKALTDQVESSQGRGRGRQIVNNFHTHTKDADGFKASTSQLAAKAAHAQSVALRRNR